MHVRCTCMYMCTSLYVPFDVDGWSSKVNVCLPLVIERLGGVDFPDFQVCEDGSMQDVSEDGLKVVRFATEVPFLDGGYGPGSRPSLAPRTGQEAGGGGGAHSIRPEPKRPISFLIVINGVLRAKCSGKRSPDKGTFNELNSF